MAITTTTAILTGLALATTAYQVKSSNDARKDAGAQADKQSAEQQKMQDDLASKERNEAMQTSQLQERERLRGEKKAAGNTILTSPLGASSTGKSVLGA